MDESKGNVSLTAVAAEAGVSLATASRVLNPDSDHPVSGSARQRVLDAAATLNYTSNALARGLKTRRSNTVAVIVHDICDPYFAECARGIIDAAEAAGMLTTICNSDRDPETELRYVEMVQQHRVAGVLFVGGGFESREYRERMARQLAAVRSYGGVSIALGPRADDLPAEVPDNEGGARIATEHLLELGHRRIAFIDGPAGLRTSVERLSGYRGALEAAGVPFDPQLVCGGSFSEAGGAAALHGLLDSGLDFSAVFASNDAMALGCMQALAGRGMRVPDDLSLVGFDDIPVVRWLDPPLTTIRVPMHEIGAAGMARLLALQQLEAGQDPGGVHVHATELVVRRSTAPVRPL